MMANKPSNEQKNAERRLQASFNEITKLLGLDDRDRPILFSRTDFGDRHYEWKDYGWDAVVTERGSEHERQAFTSDEEALFKITYDLTFGMAVKYECANRNELEDYRFKISTFQIELMGRISLDWQRRVKEKWQETLSRYPLNESGQGENW